MGTDGIFAGAASAVEADQLGNVYNAIPFKLAIESDYSDHDYTRFGAWTETSLENAADISPQINTGVFAYSALGQADYSNDLGLNFTAIYEGGTIAVDAEGSIYKGSIEVRVEWDPDALPDDVTSLISDLRNVRDSSWFQHGGQDVEHIGFSGLQATNTGSIEIAGNPTAAWVQYRNEGMQEPLSGTARINGTFVQESVDGPLGVIGQWSLSGSSSYIAIKGAFGAELVP